MVKLTGTIASVTLSLTAAPLVIHVTDSNTLSEPVTMMTIGFLLLAGFAGVFVLLLPPSGVAVKNKLIEGRGILYYTCCLFMWASAADFAIQSRHVQLFGGDKSQTKYFSHGEPYLETPLGITAQFWNSIVNYCLYLVIIYKIDNGSDPRNFAFYWSGGILTSQFVVMVGALTGSYSHVLQASVWMNVLFVVFPVWVLFKFLIKPRSDLPVKDVDTTRFRTLDIFLCFGMVAASLFSFIRGLGAFNSSFPPIKSYVENYEPYILEPTNFGAAWVLYAAMYGIPFQIAAIYGLLTPGKQWMLNLSVVYAAGMLQGSFAFTIYSWFPSAEEKFRIPSDSVPVVLFANIALAVQSHILMFRCLREPGYFKYRAHEKSQ